MNTDQNLPAPELEVITVLGPIKPEEMGITQTHEHLILDAYDHWNSYQFVIDDEEMVIEELKEYTKFSGKTIWDVTLEEIGRNPGALKRVSAASGVHVVYGLRLVPRVRLSPVCERDDEQPAGRCFGPRN